MQPEEQTSSNQANQVSFLCAEDLGTTEDRRCGSGKCGKYPLPGHTYSFREEQELKEVRENLKYDDEKERRTTTYPWLVEQSQPPNNYQAAFDTLSSTEERLQTDESWEQKDSEQSKDMADRGVARKLTKEEVSSWKGPDSYRTNLRGVLLRLREEPVGLIWDIRKMSNSVYLEVLEQQTPRFLWRNLEDRAPDVWCVTRVNMGDNPAGDIAVEAKDLTAERFKEVSPDTSSFIVGSAHVDDLIDSVPTEEAAHKLASDAETILQKGGFKLKEWFFDGVGANVDVDPAVKQVPGASWDPQTDNIIFNPCLNFSTKKQGIPSGPRPPDSPRRQGAVEALIKTVKQRVQLATEGGRLSLAETLTEAANPVNERRIGTLSGSVSVLSVLTPNSLLLGRSTAVNPGGYGEYRSVSLDLHENIAQQSWEQWTQLYAPTLLRHAKWKEGQRCLKVGDVVLVRDNVNISFKGKYRLTHVVEIFPGADGVVRKVRLALKGFKVGDTIHEYKGPPDINIERSVQRLILLVPVD